MKKTTCTSCGHIGRAHDDEDGCHVRVAGLQKHEIVRCSCKQYVAPKEEPLVIRKAKPPKPNPDWQRCRECGRPFRPSRLKPA
jgi:hypothetical protein